MNIDFEDLLYRLKNAVCRCWLVARNRPFFTCPCCEGKGGSVQGYYEPEWTECYACYDYWEKLEDWGWDRFVGRLPAWAWLRTKVALRFGFDPQWPIRDMLRCRLGWHCWMNEDRLEPGLRICARCWKDKKVEVGPMEFVHMPGGGMGWMPLGSGCRPVKEEEIGVPKWMR